MGTRTRCRDYRFARRVLSLHWTGRLVRSIRQARILVELVALSEARQ